MRVIVPTLVLLYLGVAQHTVATTLTVVIDTSSVQGLAGQLALDFVDGGPPSNSVAISHLAIVGGSFGVSPVFTGGASGNPSTTISLLDSGFFNEALLPIIIGNQISFAIQTTDLPPSQSSFPDSFTAFLLDSSGTPVISTNDPTGGDALLQVDAGSNSFRAFSPDVMINTSSVPEPRTYWIVLSGGLLGGLLRRRLYEASR